MSRFKFIVTILMSLFLIFSFYTFDAEATVYKNSEDPSLLGIEITEGTAEILLERGGMSPKEIESFLDKLHPYYSQDIKTPVSNYSLIDVYFDTYLGCWMLVFKYKEVL